VSWEFCGVRGDSQDELHFWMEDGVCYPGVFGGACDSLSSHPTSVPLALPSGEPSGEPSSCPTGIPSAAPSIVPSPLPTSVPSSSPSATPTTEPSFAPTELGTFVVTPELECVSECEAVHENYGNRTCLYVTLSDSFGDGWQNGSMFYYWAEIQDRETNVVNSTLDCDCTIMAGCFEPSELNIDQLFHMTVVATDAEGVVYVPEYAWEVQWTVQVVEGGVWKEKYYGGYNSSFVFAYDLLSESESHSLSSWSTCGCFLNSAMTAWSLHGTAVSPSRTRASWTT